MSRTTPAQAAMATSIIGQPTYSCISLLQLLLFILTVPYRRAFKLYTWQPIKEIRAANGDRKALIPLVRDWKTDKYAELQSVQVAVSSTATFSSFHCSRSLTMVVAMY
jgi:hypothetical protein